MGGVGEGKHGTVWCVGEHVTMVLVLLAATGNECVRKCTLLATEYCTEHCIGHCAVYCTVISLCPGDTCRCAGALCSTSSSQSRTPTSSRTHS